jgi:hypothetical protein
MPSIEDVREEIRRISQRPKNVTLDEIEWVVNQLKLHHGFTVRVRRAKHFLLYSVGGRRFAVNVHNPGQKQVKPYSVKDFLEAMIDLELFEDK